MIAYRLPPKIAVPSSTMLRIRCVAMAEASASCVLFAPRSGSKRFFSTMFLVFAARSLGGASFASSATEVSLAFPGLGRSHGPACQS